MPSHSSIILGITGGIACGKSEAGEFFKEENFQVLDTDVLAHESIKRGSSAYKSVVEKFGENILSSSVEIDREKLGVKVFSDCAARKELEKIIHPYVIEKTREWICACRNQKQDGVVLVPLLFEVGWIDDWDAIICVTANENNIFHRLGKRGLNKKESKERLAAQMALSEKENRSDFIIENNGTLDELKSKIEILAEQIRKQ